MNRTTNAQLQSLCDRMNALSGAALNPYVRALDGSYHPAPNCFHLYGAYGGTGLHQMMPEGTGVHEIFGITTKRELAAQMRAWIKGAEAGQA